MHDNEVEASPLFSCQRLSEVIITAKMWTPAKETKERLFLMNLKQIIETVEILNGEIPDTTLFSFKEEENTNTNFAI